MSMKHLPLLLTCMLCCCTSFVFSQDKKEKETIKINGSADTLVMPDYCDLYIMKITDNSDETGMAAQNRFIKRLLYRSGIDTSKVTLTSVIGNEYGGGKRAGSYNVVITLRAFNVSSVVNIKARLSENEYRVIRCTGQLSDTQFDKEAVNKLLLSRAIRNGKEKANEVASELGMKSLEFVSFSEGDLKEEKNGSYGYGMDGDGTGKIKLTKQVTLVYRPADGKK